MNYFSALLKKYVLPVFLSVFTCFAVLAQTDTIRPVHVGLVYPISSNGTKAAEFTNRFSLHVIAGLSKNETSVAVAGVGNVIRQNATGVQIAGVVNLTGNNSTGVQTAGFANITGHNAKGAQISGFMNLAGSAQAAQVAGFTNIVTKNSKGIQLAGFLNKSGNADNQIAGFMNIAKNVKGVQLAGLINIADSSDYPIGLLNFVKNGEKSISISVDETMTGLATFRSGGKYLYGIVGVGYNFKNTDRDLYAVEAGLGAHIPLAGQFRINVEAVNLALSDFKKGMYMKNSLRILPAFKVGNRIEIFAGPTINYVTYSKESGKGLVDKYLWSKLNQEDFKGLFLGFTGGVQIML